LRKNDTVNLIISEVQCKSESGGNKQKAKQLLANIYQNVVSLDKSDAASVSIFESGTGDVIVTYENTLIAANQSGKNYGPSRSARCMNLNGCLHYFICIWGLEHSVVRNRDVWM